MSDDMIGYKPAFPVTLSNSIHATGIEMRDYFAAHALTGLISNKAYDTALADEMAVWAYKFADAMCEERLVVMEVK